jgi:hypothetical protein
MIREWINRVLKRSIKTTISEERIEDMIVPMTHVPEEFRRVLNAKILEKQEMAVRDVANTSQKRN